MKKLLLVFLLITSACCAQDSSRTTYAPHDLVTCAVKDAAGRLWFGTNYRGIYCVDGKEFRHFGEADGLTTREINALVQDREGTIWAATGDGPYRFDGKRFSRFATPADTARGIRNPKKPHFMTGEKSSVVSCMLQDKNGDLWFGTMSRGVYRYDGHTFTNYLADEWIYCMAEDKAGNLWFGSQKAGGIYRYDGQQFINLVPKDGPYTDPWIRCLVFDRAGQLWIGCRKGGIFRYDGTAFHAFTDNMGDCAGGEPILQDQAGMIWLGSCGKGLQRYDGKALTTFTVKEGLRSNRICCLVEDKNGQLWLGGDAGSLVRYDGNTFTDLSEKIH